LSRADYCCGARAVCLLRASSRHLLNTSFNVRGEPIVCSPEDAYKERFEVD
jgi:hypothetical protein